MPATSEGRWSGLFGVLIGCSRIDNAAAHALFPRLLPPKSLITEVDWSARWENGTSTVPGG